MKAICISALLLLGPVGSVFGWGQEGHSIVAEIAQRRLSPAAQAQIEQILGHNVSLGSIASWADDNRDLFGKSFNWHFVDIPLANMDYDPARDCQDTPRGDCVINAIERNKQILGNPLFSSKDRLEALKYIVHFVGDIHQPLHTVKDHVGGIQYPVTFFIDPAKKKKEQTNLHAIWDSNLIRTTVWDWGAYVTRLEEQWLPGKDVGALSRGTPIQWALEAHKIAIDVAFTAPIDADLGEDYLKLAQPMVDQQLALAGLRLARTLNEIFK